MIKTPDAELIEALSDLSSEESIFNSWFVQGNSIEDDFDFIFNSPHIDWNTIAPKSKSSPEYGAFFSIFDELTGDLYKSSDNNNHVSIDRVQSSVLWRRLAPLASRLKDMVEAEVQGRRG